VIHLITDIFDPSKGSEWQVAVKPIRHLVSLGKSVELWYLEGGDSTSFQQRWLIENGYDGFVNLRPVKMKFADQNGNHFFRLLFLLDLLRLYVLALKRIGPDSLIWKAGQVNIIFNLIFISLRKKIICGPVSGLEFPPVYYIFRNRSFNLFIKYLFYVLLIFFVKFILKVIFTFKRHDIVILCATKTDLDIIRFLSKRNNAIKSYQYTEVDIETLLIKNKLVRKETALRGKNIIWCGSFIERKNPLFAIKTALYTCSIDRHVEFTFIGEGPQLQRCKDLALGSKDKDRIHFLTFMPREKLLSTLPMYDIAFVTSWREVNSVFIFEAISRGLIIVSSNISGMRELIEPPNKKFHLSSTNEVSVVGNLITQVFEDKYDDMGRQKLLNIYGSEKKLISDLFEAFE